MTLRTFLPALIALSLLTACAVGPDYQRPSISTPAAYKEAKDWKPSEPSDEAPRGKWWESYKDPQLTALAQQVEISNLNVQMAQAQFRQAAALLDSAYAGYFPTLSGNLSGSRGRAASTTSTSSATDNAIRNSVKISLSASWEADVWGRIGRNVEASAASAQAGNADLQSAILSAQSTLAQTYIQLRVNDALRQLFERTVAAYQRSLEITKNRYEAGIAGRADVAQAEVQLKSAQAQLIDLGIQRAQLEHALALLIGKAPAEFKLEPTYALPTLPQIPVGLPSALLERRPDIAAAERRMAAANAEIGVAQAAFFPALTLGASAGYQNSSFSHLMTLPNRFWSLGPALALTLFDAGARSAQKEQAIAGYDKSVASYRQTVLTAFQEVEDNLVALRLLTDEAEVQNAAAKSAAESLTIANNQYQAGTVSYLNVVVAQTASLSADRSSIDITGRRLLGSVALLKALGGDWRMPETK